MVDQVSEHLMSRDFNRLQQVPKIWLGTTDSTACKPPGIMYLKAKLVGGLRILEALAATFTLPSEPPAHLCSSVA